LFLFLVAANNEVSKGKERKENSVPKIEKKKEKGEKVERGSLLLL